MEIKQTGFNPKTKISLRITKMLKQFQFRNKKIKYDYWNTQHVYRLKKCITIVQKFCVLFITFRHINQKFKLKKKKKDDIRVSVHYTFLTLTIWLHVPTLRLRKSTRKKRSRKKKKNHPLGKCGLKRCYACPSPLSLKLV